MNGQRIAECHLDTLFQNRKNSAVKMQAKQSKPSRPSLSSILSLLITRAITKLMSLRPLLNTDAIKLWIYFELSLN